MDVKDLMIGDWVNYSILNLNAKVFSILGNHTIGIQFIDKNNKVEAIHGLLEEVIRPIPLTEEILAKNFGGYDHIDYDKEGRLPCYFVGNRRIFVGSVMDKGRCFYFCHKDDWAGLHDIEIHYVHQLQHLMRLCGIEKKIEL